MGLIKQQRIKKINAGVSRTARGTFEDWERKFVGFSHSFFLFIHIWLHIFLEVDQTVRFFCFMCVFVLTICLFCTFGFDIDFLFCFFFFTLNLLFFVFFLKYLISVQKFDILPSSLQSSVSMCEGALVPVYV